MTIPASSRAISCRNPRRTFLTVISVGVSLGLVMVLRTLVTEIMRPMDEMSQNARIVVRHRVSLGNYLPRRYRYAVRNLPGVKAVTPLQWFQRHLQGRPPRDMFARFAVEPTTFFQVFGDLKPTKPEYFDRFLSERRACLSDETAGAITDGRSATALLSKATFTRLTWSLSWSGRLRASTTIG